MHFQSLVVPQNPSILFLVHCWCFEAPHISHFRTVTVSKCLFNVQFRQLRQFGDISAHCSIRKMRTSHPVEPLFLWGRNWTLIVDLKAICTFSPDLHPLTVLSAMLLFHWQNTAYVSLFFLHQNMKVFFTCSVCTHVVALHFMGPSLLSFSALPSCHCNPLRLLHSGILCTTQSSPQREHVNLADKCVCEHTLPLVTFHEFAALLKSWQRGSILHVAFPTGTLSSSAVVGCYRSCCDSSRLFHFFGSSVHSSSTSSSQHGMTPH